MTQKAKIFRITIRILRILYIIFAIIGIVGITCVLTFKSFTLTSDGCVAFFGVTPEELMNTELELFDEIGDFRKLSHINKDGSLVIILSPSQQKAWRNSEWLSGFSEYTDSKTFSISSDFSGLTVYIPHVLDKEGEEWQEMNQHTNTIIDKLFIIQMLDGVPFDDIYIDYTEIDETTGEILFNEHLKWKKTK